MVKSPNNDLDDTTAAIVNVNGCCNIAPIGMTLTIHNRTFTVNSNGSVTVSGAGDGNNAEFYVPMSLEAGTYKMSGSPLTEPATFGMVAIRDNGHWVVSELGQGVEFTITNENITHYMLIVFASADLTTPKTFYPMIYDARLNPTGYVPYAMTNRELTERTIKLDEGVVYYEVQGTTDNYGQIDVGLNLNRVTGIFAKDPIGAIAVRATSGNTLQIWAVNNSSATADTLKQIRNEFVSLMIAALPNSEV